MVVVTAGSAAQAAIGLVWNALRQERQRGSHGRKIARLLGVVRWVGTTPDGVNRPHGPSAIPIDRIGGAGRQEGRARVMVVVVRLGFVGFLALVVLPQVLRNGSRGKGGIQAARAAHALAGGGERGGRVAGWRQRNAGQAAFGDGVESR